MKTKSDLLLLILLFMVLFIAPFAVDLQVHCVAVAPLAVLGAAAGLNAVNGAVNNIVNRSNMRESADIAMDLMDYQWENFQSPRAQSKSMRAAGLNPAVAFGQGGTGHFSSPSVNMPTLPPVNFGLSGSELANVALAASQAKKAGNEAVGQALNNKLLDATLEDRIQQVALQNNWTKEDTARITQEVGLMSGQFNLLQQKIDNLKSEKQLTVKHVDWYERQMTAEINDLQASAKYKNAVADLTDQQKELLTRSMQDLVDINHLNAENLSQVVGLLKKYGDAQAVVGMLTQLIGSASDLMGAFMKIPKIKDFLSNKD